ncbi:histidine kinase [Glaciecola sp. MH2013]|uniref:sensor histidine kinase n=1 Tax=Glaciecola sp. MH2013 TaxID=2785524 RepID=UPI00189FF650|nr:histidine kinase [Glaciecola sp. MH2013]MBF7074511.1 histidine kinase [Glaciecola sp. MH2013]
MSAMKPHLGRYFWLINIAFWIAVLGLFVHIQYGAAEGTEYELTWLNTWVLMSPWFLSWIVVTGGVFHSVAHTASVARSTIRKVTYQVLTMAGLLSMYWAFCSAMRIVLRDDSFADYINVFIFILQNSSQLDIAIYLGILACALGLSFYHQSMERNIEVKHLQNQLIQEQLKALRSQLNPHFLFNTLNTIASLVRLKREKDAVSALAELSMMLRKILENKNDSDIRIKDEISFINSYLTIQKMRFSDKLETHISVAANCLDLEIPNMLLQPLVENAVQHGSQLESNQNPLSLNISRDENELTFTMVNKVAQNDHHDGFGIGLSNTRERLTRLYSSFRLELRPLKEGLFETVLAIPIGVHHA